MPKFIVPSTPITNLEDVPITYPAKDKDGSDIKKTLNLSHVIREALLTDYPNEKVGFAEAAERIDLCDKYADSDSPVELRDKDREKLKELISKRWSIMIAGKSVRILDNAPNKNPDLAPVAEAAE